MRTGPGTDCVPSASIGSQTVRAPSLPTSSAITSLSAASGSHDAAWHLVVSRRRPVSHRSRELIQRDLAERSIGLAGVAWMVRPQAVTATGTTAATHGPAKAHVDGDASSLLNRPMSPDGGGTLAKSARRTNPVILRQGMTIGSSNTESDDEFLFSCFVHHPPVEQCRRVQSPATVIAGRTGAGNTAILR